MDALFGKLTILAYEFFGVILPGGIATTYLVLFWMSLGPLVEPWSLGQVPQLTLHQLGEWNSLFEGLEGAVILAVFVVGVYLLGHSIGWLARRRVAQLQAVESLRERLWLLLCLRTPRLTDHFDAELQPLFKVASERLGIDGAALSWRAFYPVAKSLIGGQLPSSLVTLYQNKYTLHRALSIASALLFWVSLVGVIGALVSRGLGKVHGPNWLLLLVLLACAAIAAAGFSASYLTAWKLFGDTVVAEAYLLTGERKRQP